MDTFSLYGPDGPRLGPGRSVYAAQVLANRGIAVLQMQDMDAPGLLVTPQEPEVHAAAYEAAIARLVADGLVARDKVGLVGFSRTGWHVLHALTHSGFPYVAALVSDNYDGSYLQAALIWNDENAKNIGAVPFGKGLDIWRRRAPGFNA